MAVNDPRMGIKNLLGGVTATLDDNATAADIIVVYTGSPENYKQWFYIYDYDVVISVDPPSLRESGNARRIDFDPIRFEGRLNIQASAVDKTGLTATKVLNKVKNSVDAVMIAASLDAYSWNAWIETVTPIVAPMGGYDPIWMQRYVIRYRPQRGIY